MQTVEEKATKIYYININSLTELAIKYKDLSSEV